MVLLQSGCICRTVPRDISARCHRVGNHAGAQKSFHLFIFLGEGGGFLCLHVAQFPRHGIASL